MKRRDFVIKAATVVGTLPIVKTALGQSPCPPGAFSIEGGTSGTVVSCGEGAASSLIQVRRTPEQIAVYASASSFDAAAYATLEYKLASETTWRQGHPLYRVRPGTADDAFAGCIFDLQPGQIYDVRVTFVDGSGTGQEQAQFSTRGLPAGVSQRTPDATPASVSAIQTAIDEASPGDVIEIQNGSYNLSSAFDVNVSGTEANPIYIRGQSKDGVVITAAPGRVFEIYGDNVVVENLTIDGNRPANDETDLAMVVRLGTTSTTTNNFTMRDCIVRNCVTAVQTAGGSSGGYSHNCLVYNNEFSGTLQWILANLSVSTFGNDGIRLVGYGNCVWNNTITGFSDSVTFAHSRDEASVALECNYAYRNLFRNSMDNVAEFDHAQRFHAFYDNYCENLSTGVSQSDNTSTTPNYGPTYVFRNVFANVAIRWVKFNAGWEGWHHYNNTYIRTRGVPGEDFEQAGFIQNSQPGRWNDRWLYKNNIHICRHTLTGDLLNFRASEGPFDGCEPSHNAWYPDGSRMRWPYEGPTYVTGVTEAIAGTETHPTVYPLGAGLSTNNRWHQFDKLSESNPWTNTLTLGATSETELTDQTSLEISSSSVLKNAGVEIPGITDGYSGSAPDMGAVIEGREVPVWGAQ